MYVCNIKEYIEGYKYFSFQLGYRGTCYQISLIIHTF